MKTKVKKFFIITSIAVFKVIFLLFLSIFILSKIFVKEKLTKENRDLYYNAINDNDVKAVEKLIENGRRP